MFSERGLILVQIFSNVITHCPRFASKSQGQEYRRNKTGTGATIVEVGGRRGDVQVAALFYSVHV